MPRIMPKHRIDKKRLEVAKRRRLLGLTYDKGIIQSYQDALNSHRNKEVKIIEEKVDSLV